MNHLGVLLVPVRAHSSIPRNNNLDTIPMRRRTTNSPVTLPPKRNRLGVNFQEEVGGGAGEEVALVPHIFQSLQGIPSSINDNQSSLNPPVQLSVSSGDFSQVQRSANMDFQETVNCLVVAPAVTVTGQSQKKDVSPFQSNVAIKSVKGVSCVSHCLCPTCQKCPSCYQRSTCGRPSANVLASLALPGFKSKGSVHTKGRVFPTL